MEAQFTVVIYTFLNNWAKNFPPPEVSQLCLAKVPLVWLWAVAIWAKHWSRETMFLLAQMLACLGIKFSKDLIILIWVSSRNQAKFKCLCNDFTLKSNATFSNFLPLLIITILCNLWPFCVCQCILFCIPVGYNLLLDFYK